MFKIAWSVCSKREMYCTLSQLIFKKLQIFTLKNARISKIFYDFIGFHIVPGLKYCNMYQFSWDIVYKTQYVNLMQMSLKSCRKYFK